MKKRNYFILFVSFGILFASCKKDNPGEFESFDNQYGAFSSESVEANKANLEETGFEMVEELEALKENEAMDVMSSMSSMSDPFDDGEVIAQPLKVLVDIKNSANTGNELLAAIKNTKVNEPVFTEEWEKLVGKYTWNSTKEDWDFTVQSNALIIEFPGKEGDISNTANITVNNFSVMAVSPRAELELGTSEMLTSIDMKLTYNSKVLASFEFRGTYQSDAIPLTGSAIWTMGAYKLVDELVNQPTTFMSAKQSFKNGDKILFEQYAEVKGNWSEENIKMLEEWDEESETVPDVDKLLSSANSYVRVMDIKVAGLVNIAAGVNELKAIDFDNTQGEELNAKAVTIINANAKLVVVYAETNQLIAKAEAYLSEDEDGYKEPDMRFVFADGSKNDVELYLEDAFSGVEDEWMKFEEDLKTKFGWTDEEF